MSEQASAKANGFTSEFVYEKSTKNTERYRETTVPPRIGTLYVQRFAIGKAKHLKVTVEVLE